MKIQKKQLFNNPTDIFFLFLAGAVIGWLYEVMLYFSSYGRFINRGLLHGPWLPIYGTGCILMIALKKKCGNKPACYFVVCVAASGVLEYATSWLLEAIYHKRWWDYSNLPLNLHGRIFAAGLIGFGAAACLFVYLVFPIMARIYKMIPVRIRKGTAAILTAVFILDLLASLFFPNIGIGITKR